MSFNTQNTSKFAVLEFGAGTQPKQAAAKKTKEAKKGGEDSSVKAKTTDSSSEGEGKIIENLILTALSTDGRCSTILYVVS
jgi:hypothetical protein